MKLVGLVPVRNGAGMIGPFLQALAPLCDAIVVLDDCSDDSTLSEIEGVARACHVEPVIRKGTWHRDEPADRNLLLAAGRAAGGTHFVVIDADEMFTCSWVQDRSLRDTIAGLPPGGRLTVPWLNLWRGFEFTRVYPNAAESRKDVAFCDDGVATYQSDFIHTQRTPAALEGPEVYTEGNDDGLVHFQFVSWRNVLIKQAWYRCLELIRHPTRPSTEINTRYRATCDESELYLRPTPEKWLAGYPFLNRHAIETTENWRIRQISSWLEQHGPDYFSSLEIWQPDVWPEATGAIETFVRCHAAAQPPAAVTVDVDTPFFRAVKKEFLEVDTAHRRTLREKERALATIHADADTRLEQIKRLDALAQDRYVQIQQLDRSLQQLNELHRAEQSRSQAALKQATAEITELSTHVRNGEQRLQDLDRQLHEVNESSRGEQVRSHTALLAAHAQIETLSTQVRSSQDQLIDLDRQLGEVNRSARGEIERLTRHIRLTESQLAEMGKTLQEKEALLARLDADVRTLNHFIHSGAQTKSRETPA